MSNLQIKINKLKLNKLIEEKELEKSDLLLRLGQLTYKKIREGATFDLNFENICENIEEVDKLIYITYTELNNMAVKNNEEKSCVCGFSCNDDSNFCPECGEKLEYKSLGKIICNVCESEIDEDSNFCVCCGYKVKNEIQSIENDDIYEM